MSWNPFGRHLYHQIVIPLVVAAILVAVAATAVAVHFLNDLTTDWVDEVARGVVTNLNARIDARADGMLGMAEIIGGDQHLIEYLNANQVSQAQGLIEADNALHEYDNTMLVNSDGRVAASSGSESIRPGDTLFDAATREHISSASSGVALVPAGSRMLLIAFSQMRGYPDSYVVIADEIDGEFMKRVAGGTGESFAFYDANKRRIATSVRPSSSRPAALSQALVRAWQEESDAVSSALSSADNGRGTVSVQIVDDNYRMSATPLTLSNDPAGSPRGYLVGIVSQSVSNEARVTTTNLIALWSIVAVFALAGLGTWVARRVSGPLETLTEGARQITEGDFSTMMPVKGSNEISELAMAFNQMTDSLQDRSESLTKKVLELATLYEMSRALGSTLVMDVLLESVLDSALRIFGVDSGYATLRNRETGQLELLACRADASAPVDEQALRNSMSEWVICEGRPLIFNPPRESEVTRVDEVTGALAALCVPLNSPEGVLGALTVGSHDPSFRFGSDDVRLLSTIANHVTIAVGNIELFSSLQDAYLATVRSLAAAVDAKDPYTRGHSERVASYAVAIAKELELSHDQQVALEMAAYLHDIGKIGVREEILLKPGKLSDDEMSLMRHHPLIGANILKPVGFPWPITPVVRHHHERWDGQGYPAGLKGEEIPFLARILTIADSYEAMVSDRPYRRGRTSKEAIAELQECAGRQFDVKIVDAFVSVLESGQFAEALESSLPLDQIQADEIEAIFVALSEGMFTSFRRLAGPRLSSNVEQELNTFFVDNALPFRLANGRMTMGAPGGGGNGDGPIGSLDDMRYALEHMDETMGRMSGASLVDHFYADAAGGLSDRMRTLAVSLRFLRV
ncbi:MAG: HD domain-containing phosphohydrolase [Coriobacteriia bacterium]